MAAAASAPPALSPGEPTLAQDDSNVSSPLSDVDDDKDADADDIDGMQVDTDGHNDEASDSDSNLSEAEDTEAETERLYDTPQNPRHKDVVIDKYNNGQIFEHTPSKLNKSITVRDGLNHGDEDSLSDDISMASSQADEDDSPSKPAKSTEISSVEEAKPIPEPRKRKRSLVADPPELEQPPRKRTGSIVTAEAEPRDEDAVMVDDEALSANPLSGEQSATEDVGIVETNKDEPSPGDDTASNELSIAKKSTRNGNKRKSEAINGGEKDEVDLEHPDDSREAGTEEEGEPHGEDEEMDADGEEDADAAGKNDEERE
jgi:hypothetical protein